MRNGRLRQLYALLDIGGAKPGFLIEGASAFFLECLQNSAARRIGDSVQKAIKIRRGVRHDEEG